MSSGTTLRGMAAGGGRGVGGVVEGGDVSVASNFFISSVISLVSICCYVVKLCNW